MVVNKKNPFAYKAKQAGKKKTSGKSAGKSRPEKAKKQLHRRVKKGGDRRQATSLPVKPGGVAF